MRRMNCLLPFRKHHNAQNFSSTPSPCLDNKCYSVASISSTPIRRTTNYQPSPWDDSQIQSLNITSFTGDVHVKRREELKEEVKWLIKEKGFADQLELFDLLQKLGVAYHFEEEIKDSLHLMRTLEEELRMTNDAYVMAMYFRLSREHGLVASKDLLVQCYKDKNGSYKPSVLHDTKGILSLYEASFLAMDGEDELDELKEFTLKQLRYLKTSNSSTNPKLSEYIAKALELPLHHRIPKLQAPIFIRLARDIEEVNPDPIVIEFAQLDFNMTQSIYIRELKEITSYV
ncbi:alpha-terpineol synthase, chloroplastic-like [Phalaenopsis equestris]|uniref:alpha-terpineol synthase, chloroplastic-like n=1 Tax=Phalaenopsis equestris TaxID=78828 RepID=UPI0009E37962|nr:alpha-terpineol synthase, chloroplastic-like [Phalaenopsis equestris]